MASRVFIVGCGDLGIALASRLCASDYQVTGLSRSAKPLIHPNLTYLLGDVTRLETLSSLTGLTPEFLVYCVAADTQSDAAYQAQYVNGLKNILSTQVDNSNLRAIFFVSSTRVYGQVRDEWLNESTLPEPADFGGERLLEAEQVLRHFAGRAKNCQKTVLRLSGIYGPGRTRMLRMAQAPDWPLQNAWTNRIHRDDAAAFVAHLLGKVRNDQVLLPCYVVTDSKPALQWEVLSWLAQQLRVEKNMRTMPPVSGGKKLSNAAMLATGFQLQYPDYQTGYAMLLK